MESVCLVTMMTLTLMEGSEILVPRLMLATYLHTTYLETKMGEDLISCLLPTTLDLSGWLAGWLVWDCNRGTFRRSLSAPASMSTTRRGKAF